MLQFGGISVSQKHLVFLNVRHKEENYMYVKVFLRCKSWYNFAAINLKLTKLSTVVVLTRDIWETSKKGRQWYTLRSRSLKTVIDTKKSKNIILLGICCIMVMQIFVRKFEYFFRCNNVHWIEWYYRLLHQYGKILCWTSSFGCVARACEGRTPPKWTSPNTIDSHIHAIIFLLYNLILAN